MVIWTDVSVIVFILDMNDQFRALRALADSDRVNLDYVNLSIDYLLGHIQAVHVGDEYVPVLLQPIPVILGDQARQVDLFLGRQNRLDERVVCQVQDISLLQCRLHLLLLLMQLAF